MSNGENPRRSTRWRTKITTEPYAQISGKQPSNSHEHVATHCDLLHYFQKAPKSPKANAINSDNFDVYKDSSKAYTSDDILKNNKRTHLSDLLSKDHTANNVQVYHTHQTPMENYVGSDKIKVSSPIPKNKSHIRILLQNSNTFPIQDPVSTQIELESLADLQPDISLLNEINYNTSKASTYEVMFNSTKAIWESTSMIASSIPIPFESMCQPGGTLSIAHGKMTGRVQSKTKDIYGRWTCIKLYQAGAPPICVINAYMPLPQSRPGPTAYQNQLYQLMKDIYSITKVREKCWVDLEEYVRKLCDEGMSVILGMDENANPREPHSLISKLKANCNLTDPLEKVNPQQLDIPTYGRGQ